MSRKRYKKGDVIFRRIRGRIVPIRVKPGVKRLSVKQKNKALVSGLVRTGAGFGIAAGLTGLGTVLFGEAQLLGKEARSMGETAYGFIHKGIKERGATPGARKARSILWRGAVKRARKVKRMAYGGKGLVFGGSLLGGALVSAGVERIIKKDPRKSATLRESMVADVTGGLTALAGTLAFTAVSKRYKGLQAIRKAIKK